MRNLLEPEVWDGERPEPLPWWVAAVVLLVCLAGLIVLPAIPNAAWVPGQPTANTNPNWQIAHDADLPVATLDGAKRFLTVYEDGAAVATYDLADKRLTIDPSHLPADALLCIGDTCKLASGWVQR